MAESRPKFDPYGLLQALDRHRVTYLVIGGFARIVQGTEEITRGLDIVPSTREENLRRLDAALRDVGARRRRRTRTLTRPGHARRPARARAHHRPRRAQARPRAGWHAAATTTSAAQLTASRSAAASDPPSPRSATSPAWSPRSATRNASPNSCNSAASSSSNSSATASSSDNAYSCEAANALEQLAPRSSRRRRACARADLGPRGTSSAAVCPAPTQLAQPPAASLQRPSRSARRSRRAAGCSSPRRLRSIARSARRPAIWRRVHSGLWGAQTRFRLQIGVSERLAERTIEFAHPTGVRER